MVSVARTTNGIPGIDILPAFSDCAVLRLNAPVPPAQDSHTLAAGPLRVRWTEDRLRIGWDEPDWFGPARLLAPGEPPNLWTAGAAGFSIGADWVHTTVRALEDEPVVVLRLEAREARSGFATGDFATPAVAWHFDPMARDDGGAPEGVRAFGHQYTEFALPVFSDAAMSRWRLLPIRPAVVLPLGLVAPDGRTVLLAPLAGFHEQVIGVPANREQAEAGLARAGTATSIRSTRDLRPSSRSSPATAFGIASRGGRGCCDRRRGRGAAA